MSANGKASFCGVQPEVMIAAQQSDGRARRSAVESRTCGPGSHMVLEPFVAQSESQGVFLRQALLRAGVCTGYPPDKSMAAYMAGTHYYLL